MATAMQGGSAGAALQALSSLLPQLSGSKSITKESSSIDPGAQGGLQALISQLTAKSSGTGTAGYEDLLGELNQQIQLALLPTTFKANNAVGLYGNQQNDLRAMIGAQLSKATAGEILKDRTQSAGIAAQAAGSLANATRQGTKVTQTPGNPLLQALGAGAAGLSLYDKIKKSKLFGDEAAGSLTEGSTAASVAAGEAGYPVDTSFSADLGESISSDAITGSASDISYAASAIEGVSEFAPSLDFLSTGAETGVDIAGNALDAGSFGYGAAADFAGDAAGDAALEAGAETVVGEVAGNFLFPGAFTVASYLLGDDGLDVSVICTEAHRQGLISTRLFRFGHYKHGPKLPEQLMRGYHFWGKPAARLMVRNKTAARFFGFVAKSYLEHNIGYGNKLGAVITFFAHPLCSFIGAFLAPKTNFAGA